MPPQHLIYWTERQVTIKTLFCLHLFNDLPCWRPLMLYLNIWAWLIQIQRKELLKLNLAKKSSMIGDNYVLCDQSSRKAAVIQQLGSQLLATVLKLGWAVSSLKHPPHEAEDQPFSLLQQKLTFKRIFSSVRKNCEKFYSRKNILLV